MIMLRFIESLTQKHYKKLLARVPSLTLNTAVHNFKTIVVHFIRGIVDLSVVLPLSV